MCTVMWLTSRNPLGWQDQNTQQIWFTSTWFKKECARKTETDFNYHLLYFEVSSFRAVVRGLPCSGLLPWYSVPPANLANGYIRYILTSTETLLFCVSLFFWCGCPVLEMSVCRGSIIVALCSSWPFQLAKYLYQFIGCPAIAKQPFSRLFQGVFNISKQAFPIFTPTPHFWLFFLPPGQSYNE